MNTDKHRFKKDSECYEKIKSKLVLSPVLSVFICVHLWLKILFLFREMRVFVRG